MSLFSPSALLWLIPLAGVILALYLLKMKRRDLRVPATFLWPTRVEEIRANSLFQRLRFSWLLVLQLLAAGLVCFALARPQVMKKGLSGRATVVVIDSSLTMGATDVKPSRLEVAKQKAREIVNATGPGETLAVIDAGTAPEIVSPLAYDPAGETRAIDAIKQTDANPTVGEALRIASAIVGSNASGRIVLISDGEFGSITNFARGKASLAFESVGQSDRNLCITALGASEGGRGRELYCSVRNMGSVTAKGTLNVYADGVAVHSELLTVAGKADWNATFQVAAATTIFEAKLDSDDELQADDTMYLSAQKGATLHVLLLDHDDPFTEKALALDPRVSLDRGTELPATELSPKTARYDIVVFDGVPETPVGNRGVLVLGSATDSDALRVSGSASRPAFASQTSDPLLSAVDLSQVGVASSQKLSPGTAEVLASSTAGPELLSLKGAQRRVYLSFEPLKSDLPLQPAFPIFIANCLSFLGQSSDKGPLVVHPGMPFAVPALHFARATASDGSSAEGAVRGTAATMVGLPRVGKYELNVDGKKRAVYCTLDGHPVDIRPVAELSAGNDKTKSVGVALSALDIWRYVAVALLAVLVGEWFVFARRS